MESNRGNFPSGALAVAATPASYALPEQRRCTHRTSILRSLISFTEARLRRSPRRKSLAYARGSVGPMRIAAVGSVILVRLG